MSQSKMDWPSEQCRFSEHIVARSPFDCVYVCSSSEHSPVIKEWPGIVKVLSLMSQPRNYDVKIVNKSAQN